MKNVIWTLILLFWAFGSSAAVSSGITYHGRLLKPDGTPVSSNTQFKIQIRTPGAENCLMFEEQQSKDLSTSNGMFSITINDGSGVRSDAGLYTMNQIFANRGTFTLPIADCNAISTYTPGAADGRTLKVFFNDGSFAGWEPMPTQAVNFVPMAIEAYSTGGFTAKSLLRVEDGATLGNVSSLTTANFNELMALILGTSSQYTKAGQLNGSALPAMTSGQTLGWNGSAWSAVTPLTSESDPTVKAFAKSNLPTCSVGQVLKSDGTSFSCVTDAGGWTASDATTSAKGIVQISATGGIDVNAGVIQLSDVGTSGDYYKVHTDAKGRVVSGSAALVEADIPTLSTAGKVSGSAITSGTIGGTTNFNSTGSVFGNIVSTQSLRIFEATNSHKVTVVAPSALSVDYTMTLPLDKATVNGQVLTSDTSGVLSWTTVSAGGGGTVTSVTSGGLPIVVGGTAVAPTVSVNAASTSTTGVVQLAANGGTTSGTVVQADDSRLTNGRAPNGSAGGDLSGTYPNPDVAAIKGKAIVYTSIASGQYLKYDGTNIVNANIAIGDVTNLSTQLSNKLDSSNMPANCSAGSTLTFSSPTGTWACTAIVVSAGNFGSQSQNTFLAGPTSGSGTPTFRAIAVADLPASASYWTAATGGINYAGGNVGIGTTSPGFALTVGDGASKDGSLIAQSYGTLGTNGANLAVSGAGSRMMWYGKKGAFRAGAVSGTAWDDANIGINSIGLGMDAKATSVGSIAIGNNVTSTGGGAIVLGAYSTSSGIFSAALGNNATATGDGSVAFSMGTASGGYSTAIGNSTASGWNSIAMVSGKALSTNSIAAGEGATADSYDQTTFGAYNMPKGGETTLSWIATDPLFVVGNGTGVGASRSTALMILKNGNVGIGTTNPQATLDVNGGIATNASYEEVATYVNSGTAYTIPDANTNIRRITLTGNATITLPAYAPSLTKLYSLTLFLKQDGTGGRTISFVGNGSDVIKWDSGSAPSVATVANKISILQLMKPADEAVWYGSLVWREN